MHEILVPRGAETLRIDQIKGVKGRVQRVERVRVVDDVDLGTSGDLGEGELVVRLVGRGIVMILVTGGDKVGK